MKRYLADSQEETILLKMAPEIRHASITPIPAAVLLINTDSINDKVAATRETNQAKPNSINIYCHWEIRCTPEVFNTPVSKVKPVKTGAAQPLKPNTSPDIKHDSATNIKMITDTERTRVMYLLKSILHRLTGLVSNNFTVPMPCSEDTRSAAITSIINGKKS